MSKFIRLANVAINKDYIGNIELIKYDITQNDTIEIAMSYGKNFTIVRSEMEKQTNKSFDELFDLLISKLDYESC